jgi:hypothetical protein
MSGTPLWCATIVGNAQISPDGTLIAAAASQFRGSTNTTSIYKNGSLVGTMLGTSVGWLDNARLLAVLLVGLRRTQAATDHGFRYDEQPISRPVTHSWPRTPARAPHETPMA